MQELLKPAALSTNGKHDHMDGKRRAGAMLDEILASSPVRMADEPKESAVVGFLGIQGFHGIPAHAIIEPECFSSPVWGTLYAAAYDLHKKGRVVSTAGIIESIERNYYWLTLVQNEAKVAGSPDWKNYLLLADTSLGWNPRGGEEVGEYLKAIADSAAVRKTCELGKRMLAGELSLQDAIERLQGIQGAGAAQQIEPLLDARRISLTNPPTKPLPILTLGGQQISTAGNLTAIAAQAKHGKSAAVGATLASFFGESEDGGDFLGFESEPANGKAVVLFDTEQSPFDAWQLISRSMRRAGLSKLPPNLRAYAVLDLSVEDRLRALRAELERAAKDCGGIHAIFIDGVADLCLSVNDEAEANGLIADLVALAVKFSCPIICVLHENPAQPGLAGKTRGHLGSQLERKAESNLRIKKDNDGISVIFSERCRSANIPEATAPRFKYCEKAGMHISCESAGVAKAEADREEMREEVREIFNTPDSIAGFSWADVLKRLEEINGIKSSGARKRLEKLTKAGLIKKNSAGLYTR